MDKRQFLWGLGGAIIAVAIGVASMTAWSLEPAVSIPIMLVLALAAAACFICAWPTEDALRLVATNVFADYRAIDSKAIKAILSDADDRRRFVEQMRNGTLTTWAHRKGLKDPVRLAPNVWNYSSLEYEEVDGRPITNVLRHVDSRKRPWTKTPAQAGLEQLHDVYFSQEQLQKEWPGRF